MIYQKSNLKNYLPPSFAIVFSISTIYLFGSITYAANCNSNSHWVRAHHRTAYYKNDGTFVRASEVSAHCQRNPEGYKFWNGKIKNGLLPSWPNKTETSKSWTQGEIEHVLEALSELPSELWGDYIEGIL